MVLKYEKTSRTDRFQHYLIRLESGCLTFADSTENGDAKAEKLVNYLNENKLTDWSKFTEYFRCKLVIANVEFKMI